MTKHTPAPWKVTRTRATEDTHHHEVLARDTEYHREVVICECFPINDDGQLESESAANARLIAAAPELLEALKAAEAKLNQIAGVYGARLDGTELETSKVCNLIVAAILKAEG